MYKASRGVPLSLLPVPPDVSPLPTRGRPSQPDPADVRPGSHWMVVGNELSRDILLFRCMGKPGTDEHLARCAAAGKTIGEGETLETGAGVRSGMGFTCAGRQQVPAGPGGGGSGQRVSVTGGYVDEKDPQAVNSSSSCSCSAWG